MGFLCALFRRCLRPSVPQESRGDPIVVVKAAAAPLMRPASEEDESVLEIAQSPASEHTFVISMVESRGVMSDTELESVDLNECGEDRYGDACLDEDYYDEPTLDSEDERVQSYVDACVSIMREKCMASAAVADGVNCYRPNSPSNLSSASSNSWKFYDTRCLESRV
ncbi:hypothetical pox protein [Squirrelpox virus]|uniref:C6R n=1 Tax=Squirrelpox virus TaxID=240426 RepID=Q1HTQ7_9POXV|nr:hypothetical pox protein [Squirrelpox virus]ABD51479.1 C6R [Squirrelpox virus]CCD83311.1 hypothetical pox protein [Squirrelpox virus]